MKPKFAGFAFIFLISIFFTFPMEKTFFLVHFHQEKILGKFSTMKNIYAPTRKTLLSDHSDLVRARERELATAVIMQKPKRSAVEEKAKNHL